MANLSLLVDLYQYLPYKKTKDRNRSQQVQNAMNNRFDHVEKLRKELEGAANKSVAGDSIAVSSSRATASVAGEKKADSMVKISKVDR